MPCYNVLGIMSGSSLDGVDMALCRIVLDENHIENPINNWEILEVKDFPFPEEWVARLIHLPEQSARVYAMTNIYFGYFLGELVQKFKDQTRHSIDFVASHGHTIFHEPDRYFTAQIGDGAAISSKCNLPVIADFRTADVAVGGQGAPFAPVVDKYCFPDYDACVNLGGIANISFKNKNYKAFDTSPCNQLLNFLANELDLNFDDGGKIAKTGKLDKSLLDQFKAQEYYKIKEKKSLDNNYIKSNFIPLLIKNESSIPDKLFTSIIHIVEELKNTILQNMDKGKGGAILFTGGGAHNTFLIQSLKIALPDFDIVVPEKLIVDYKESLLMSVLGVLRWNNIPSVFPVITGAKKETSGGGIFV